ncbi:MAG: right-handed parallel beta-helix repeat-containing protein [Acetobacteraceae bacterium]|nr:right-handed parallel beta-helix repeat-containing protein [Acetobacteraceae bacterium]
MLRLEPRSGAASSGRIAPSEIDLRLVRQTVDNPEELEGYGAEPQPVTGGCEHVIITSRSLAGSFEPLAQWRRSQGLSSKVVAVEDIYRQYPGRDRAEQVRNFIRYLREQEGVKFVLLGGDADGADVGGESGDAVVPVRGLWAAREETDPPNIPADLYYACLDGSFDGDGDGVFGEPNDGEYGGDVDLLAEVYVGRAPVDSAWEAANFVRKTIAYESGSPGDPYYTEAWMVGELLDDDTPCAAEVAAEAQHDAEPQGIIDVLRQFRDGSVAPEYVRLYYAYSPLVKRVLKANPSLLAAAGRLLVKWAPAVGDLVRGRDGGCPLTPADAEELAGFLRALRRAVEETQAEPGAPDAGELLRELMSLEAYLGSASGQTFAAAFRASPYCAGRGAASVSPLGQTWGGDYKDEIKNGSFEHGYATAGFPSDFWVQTLYDRDDPSHDWPKEKILQILNGGPHLLNHMGHANLDYVMKLTNGDVDGLANGRFFFFYSQGCYAGAFDNRRTPGEGYSSKDCIAEHFVTGPAGAFACVANSRYGWFTPGSTDGQSQRCDRQFWDAIFGEDLPWLGVANQASKEENLHYVAAGDDYMRFCCYELNLLGDPATKVVFPQMARDLGVTRLEASARPGAGLSIDAAVVNLGRGTERGAAVTFLVDGGPIKTCTISQIAPGQEVPLSAAWTPGGSGAYTLEVRVTRPASDGNPLNNSLRKTVSVGGVLTVDDDGEECPSADFTDIAQAIAVASPGDTIKVYPGTYHPFVVDRAVQVVGVGYPVIDASGRDEHGIVVHADGAGVRRMEVRGSPSHAGIMVCSGLSAITGNVLRGNSAGIALAGARGNVIDHNTLAGNDCGLAIQSDSSGNQVWANTIEDNEVGVYVCADLGAAGLGSARPEPAPTQGGPNLLYRNIIGNYEDVLDDVGGEVCLWYHPDLRVGNYWSVAPFELDPYPLGGPYVDTGAITGEVLLRGGQAGGPVEIGVAGSHLLTVADAGGSFELAGVPLGRCSLVLTCPGYSSRLLSVDVAPGENDIGDVVLEGPIKRLWAAVDGRVVGGTPLRIPVGGRFTIEVWAEFLWPRGAKARLECSELEWQRSGPVGFDAGTGVAVVEGLGLGELRGSLQGKQVTVKVQALPRLVGIAFVPPTLERIDLQVGRASSLPPLMAEFEDGSRKAVTNEASWIVGDEEIAVVQNRKLKGLARGTTELVAEYQGFSTAPVQICVTLPVKRLWAEMDGRPVGSAPVQLFVGDRVTFEVWVEYGGPGGSTERLDCSRLTWAVAGLVSFDPGTGTVRADGVGSGQVAGSFQGKRVVVRVKVSPRLVDLFFTQEGLERIDLQVGRAQGVPKVTAEYEGGRRADVTGLVEWEVDDEAIAKVAGGRLKGVSVGTTALRARLGSLSTDDVTLVVTPVIRRLLAQTASLSLRVGETLPVAVYAVYADGTSQEDVTRVAAWTSSKPGVARVSLGNVTGVAPGTASLKATYAGKSVVIRVTVAP